MKENQQEPKQEQPKETQGNLGISFPSIAHGDKPALQKKAISTGKGSADLHDHGSAAKLYNLEVGVGKRGAGGGKELVAKASQEAMAMGKKKLVLDSQDNGSGKLDNWYKNQGFKSTGKNNGMNSFEMPLQRKEAPQNISKVEKPLLQAKTENKTGLPNKLKSKMEGTFGHSLNNIRINTNSALPAKVGAIATTQGNRIDFAPGHYNPHTSQGQKLIGHEAWHTVQQAQGRVKPTLQMKTGYLVNDSAALEKEADVMGERVFLARAISGQEPLGKTSEKINSKTVQRSRRRDKGSGRSGGRKQIIAYVGRKQFLGTPGRGMHPEMQILKEVVDDPLEITINAWPCSFCDSSFQKESEKRKITIILDGDQGSYSMEHADSVSESKGTIETTKKIIYENGVRSYEFG